MGDEPHLGILIEAAPIATIVDASGRIALINAQVERLFGYARAELFGENVEKLVPKWYSSGHPMLRQGYPAAPSAWPMGAGGDLFAMRKDGSELPVEIGLSPMQTPEGIFFLATVSDVRERHAEEIVARDEAVAELARTNAELKQRLAERTIERDDVARKEAAAELARTNMAQEYLQLEVEREHRASAAFQEAALPSRMPIVPGMQFRAICRAAKAEALVGGDWYDAFRLDDGRIVLSIGDVMGSGLLAAVTMGAVRQALRGAAQILAEPIEILDAADRVLHSEQPDSIVTAFVGILDPITLTLMYASAGHPPPLLRSADGEITALGGSGLPLGIRSMQTGASEIPHSIILDNSSLIVLYTDGLIEATRDIEVGENKVREALKSAEVWNAENPAATISDRVLDEVLDDVAIITIRIESASVSVTRPAGLMEPDARWVFEVLLSNAVRYGSDEVEFALDISGDAPVLQALDRGPGFTYNASLPMDVLSESGRGLFIVRSLTHALSVTIRHDGGSHARAVLPFAIRTRHAKSRVQAADVLFHGRPG